MSIDVIGIARAAVQLLSKHYSHGAYRVIRDPEGKVGLWAIESKLNEPFSISFVDKGRVFNRLEDLPKEMLISFAEYIQKTVGPR